MLTPTQAEARRIVVAAPGDERHAHLAWPKLVRTRDGALVVAYSAGRFHGNHGEGCPAVSVSTDDGNTFSPPRILKNFDASMDLDNSANTALGVAEDGALVLLAMAFTGEERNSIFGWRSDDSGRTWTPVDTRNLADGRTGSVYGRVFPVPGRGIAVCGHYRPGSAPRQRGVWIAFSEDHGRSWGEAKLVSDLNLVEPAMAFTQGRIVGLIRDQSQTAFYWQAVSDDLGETWDVQPSAVAAGDEPYRLPSPFIAVDPGDAARLWAIATRRHVPGNTPGRMVLWTADVATLDWRRVRTLVGIPHIDGDPNRDFGYPWMAALGGGEWFLVYYHGRKRGPSSIWGLRVRA